MTAAMFEAAFAEYESREPDRAERRVSLAIKLRVAENRAENLPRGRHRGVTR